MVEAATLVLNLSKMCMLSESCLRNDSRFVVSDGADFWPGFFSIVCFFIL